MIFIIRMLKQTDNKVPLLRNNAEALMLMGDVTCCKNVCQIHS